LPAKDNPLDYSPYANKKLLFNNQPVKIANLPVKKAVFKAFKKLL
jgi:hypothetical protein